ncbi:hypothetical protein PACTADRAFT_51922, partial [Pachysolen tannophilus NRRL Y-2460]
MVAIKSLASIRTVSNCFIRISNKNPTSMRAFTAFTNNPLLYSDMSYQRQETDFNYHLNNAVVNNNGDGHTNTAGSQVVIDNAHSKSHPNTSINENFEPVVYSPDTEVHTIAGTAVHN